MALQTKIITANGSKGHHKFTLTVTEDSTNVATNTSSVTWSFTLEPVVNGFDWESNSGKVQYAVVINGITYNGIIAKYDGKSTVTIRSGTETVTHDADGSKALSYSFSITDSTGWSFAPGAASAADTMALTAIPRGATITDAPYFNDEENPTITYTNPAGAAVTALEACISFDGSRDDIAYRPIPTDDTSYIFPLTEAERDVLRAATQGSNSRWVIFYVRTNINGTIYLSTLWRTLTVVNASPIIEPNITDTNTITSSLTGGAALIRYFSDASFTTGARAQKGATLTAQSVTCGGVTLEGANGTFAGVSSGYFVFTATDSRGNTTTVPVQMPFVDYTGLTCSIGNNRPDTDGNFTFAASGICYNGDITGAGSNELTVLYRWKVAGANWTDWLDMSVTRDGNAYTAWVNLTGLDYQTTYIFQCMASDLVTTATTAEMAIKSMPVFDWGENDFNFNVPVSVPSLTLGGVQLDYIVEHGTYGIWTYTKWNSGKCEMYGTAHQVALVYEQIGGVHRSDLLNVYLPFTVYNCHAWVDCNHRNAWASRGQFEDGSVEKNTNALTYVIWHGQSCEADWYTEWYVVGNWK